VRRQAAEVPEVSKDDDNVWLVFDNRLSRPVEMDRINSRPDLTVRDNKMSSQKSPCGVERLSQQRARDVHKSLVVS
jgi:hypothetical protein